MRKILMLVGLGLAFMANAAKLPDSVAMVVAGKPVSLPEFVFMAKKNGNVDFSDKKALNEYVELYKNFKLKVHEAEEEGLDRGQDFREELEKYQAQLKHSLLSDQAAEEAYARSIYDRGNEVLDISQILFRLPAQYVSNDTLAVYKDALSVYNKIRSGEDFDAVGLAMADTSVNKRVLFDRVRSFMPMRALKVFENAAYSLSDGSVSIPVRSSLGFHLIKVNGRRPNPGRVRVAHILIAFSKDSVGPSREEVRAKADSLYQVLRVGADFSTLAKENSDDPQSAKVGGLLPLFGPGEMTWAFENAAFALHEPGELSGLVETPYGIHILKLLERRDRPSFEQEKTAMIRVMGQGERNFELYKAHDEQLKSVYDYEFYPEAYRELRALCDESLPTSEAFYSKAKDMDKPLVRINGETHPQKEFAYYLRVAPFSTKAYSGDFMDEVFDLFVRDVMTTLEKTNFDQRHPEYAFLIGEYRDGMLLFNISNQKLWNKPVEEQPEAEKLWLEELNKKYPVEINWKVLKKLKK